MWLSFFVIDYNNNQYDFSVCASRLFSILCYIKFSHIHPNTFTNECIFANDSWAVLFWHVFKIQQILIKRPGVHPVAKYQNAFELQSRWSELCTGRDKYPEGMWKYHVDTLFCFTAQVSSEIVRPWHEFVAYQCSGKHWHCCSFDIISSHMLVCSICQMNYTSELHWQIPINSSSCCWHVKIHCTEITAFSFAYEHCQLVKCHHVEHLQVSLIYIIAYIVHGERAKLDLSL